MRPDGCTPDDFEEYFRQFPKEKQLRLKEIRSLISGMLPEAEECFRYGMPTYRLKKNIVHFAGHKEHIGIYPGPSVITALEKELQNYPCSKGAIQLPDKYDLPLELIKKIVSERLKELKEKSKG